MESAPEPTKKVEVVEDTKATEPAAGARLFGAGAVAVTSLLGTPVAGGLLLAVNSLKVGQRANALIGLVMGGLLTFSLWGTIPYLPKGTPLLVLLPVGAVLMWWVTRMLQGDLLARRRAGGAGAEMAIAVAVGVLTLGGLYLAIRPYLVRAPAAVQVGAWQVADKQVVNYVPPMTEDDARHVGAALLEVKYFDQSGVAKNVIIVPDEQGHRVVVFPADPARAADPQVRQMMALLAQQFLKSGVPLPFTIRLVGPDGKTLNEAKVQVTPATQPATRPDGPKALGLP